MKSPENMYDEDDLLPLSGLQHLMFCPRQWALIHLEGIWAENRLTAEGRHLHERVHELDSETRNGVKTVRGLLLRSLRLGLTGQADVVEFTTGEGTAVPFPVEYKRGRPKPDRCDEVQLCAQALCLEEMLGVPIPGGALFYGQPRRRHEVEFDETLRGETEKLAAAMHEMFNVGVTPPAVYEKKCDNCSLYTWCLPKNTGESQKVAPYMDRVYDDLD